MNNRFSGFVIVLLVFTSFFSICLFLLERLDTPNLYPAQKVVVFEKVFDYPKPGYIKIPFSKFDLAKSDYVEISSPDGQYSYTYQWKSKEIEDGLEEGKLEQLNKFRDNYIPGDTAIIRLHFKKSKNGFGGN